MRERKKVTKRQKGLVFCHTCNTIVGDSFPVHHGHDFGNGQMAVKMVMKDQLGFGFYKDTPKMRKHLAKDFPPRDEVCVKL